MNSELTTNEVIIATTRTWLEKAVIGLNLCPFAKAVHVKNRIRFVVSNAQSTDALLDTLNDELQFLRDTDAEVVETSLLIHPFVLNDFIDYNNFLDIADAAIQASGLSGEIQIASFHPDYQFADTSPGDIENFSNRSPYPTLHLLREDSIARAVAAFPDAADIYGNNITTLRGLGPEGWGRLWIDETS